MSSTEHLVRAIQIVSDHRSDIIAKVGLEPHVFDSWLQAACELKGNSIPNSQPLVILSTWIREMPELDEARSIINAAIDYKEPMS